MSELQWRKATIFSVEVVLAVLGSLLFIKLLRLFIVAPDVVPFVLAERNVAVLSIRTVVRIIKLELEKWIVFRCV